MFNKKIYRLGKEDRKTFLYEEEQSTGQKVKTIAWRDYLYPILIAVLCAIATGFYEDWKNRADTAIDVKSIKHELSETDISSFNFYVNGKKKTLKSKDELTIKSIKPDKYTIIGIENTANVNDRIRFEYEQELLASMYSEKKKSPKAELEFDETQFVFHRLLTPEDFGNKKILFFNLATDAPKQMPLYFTSHPQEAVYVFEEPLVQYIINEKDSIASLLTTELVDTLTYINNYTSFLSPTMREEYTKDYKITFPEFKDTYWYDSNQFTSRGHYADEMRETIRGAIYLKPYIYLNEDNEFRAGFTMSLAPLGDFKFESIPVNNCLLDFSPGNFLRIGKNGRNTLFELLEKYKSIYDTFIHDNRIDTLLVDSFVEMCQLNMPYVGLPQHSPDQQSLIVSYGGDPSDIRPRTTMGPGIYRRSRRPQPQEQPSPEENEQPTTPNEPTPPTPEPVQPIDETRIDALNKLLDKKDCDVLYQILNAFWTEDALQIRDRLDYNTRSHQLLITNSIKCLRSLMNPGNRCPDPPPDPEKIRMVARDLLNAIENNSSITAQEKTNLGANLERGMNR